LKRDLSRRAQEALARAIACGWSVVTAESCTAGALAHLLSKGEGASKHFHGGIVAYTKPMKTAVLGVPTALLRKKTAVCAEVASAMAKGALSRSPADVAVSVTGVAGPKPDEDGNPVGLIYCAVARRRGAVRTARLHCKKKGANRILQEAMRLALRLLDEACRAEANKK
jgi:nicotinamide-nucleotide amidase